MMLRRKVTFFVLSLRRGRRSDAELHLVVNVVVGNVVIIVVVVIVVVSQVCLQKESHMCSEIFLLRAENKEEVEERKNLIG